VSASHVNGQGKRRSDKGGIAVLPAVGDVAVGNVSTTERHAQRRDIMDRLRALQSIDLTIGGGRLLVTLRSRLLKASTHAVLAIASGRFLADCRHRNEWAGPKDSFGPQVGAEGIDGGRIAGQDLHGQAGQRRV
jgi:hypothetical protein